jgi:hypothetical protein
MDKQAEKTFMFVHIIPPCNTSNHRIGELEMSRQVSDKCRKVHSADKFRYNRQLLCDL